MSRRLIRRSVLVLALSGCASSAPPAAPPSGPAPASDAPPTSDPPAPAGASRPELSSEQCEAQGGTVVGDIGDGAIHRPDYLCPSGVSPTATIAAPKGGPINVEGAVCCPK